MTVKYGLIGLAVIALAAASSDAQPPPSSTSSRPEVTKDQLDRWMTELSNWGRWGKDDQIGAAHLMTPAKRKQAAALVREGQMMSMARPISPSAKTAAVDLSQPFANRAVFNDSIEAVLEAQHIFFHGSAFTHLDALCHVAYNGKVYNGLELKEIVTSDGACSKMGVMALKDGIVTRAVLLDMARFKGVPYLQPGTHVYGEEIEAWEAYARVKISSGDAVLLRTGRAPKGGSGFDSSVIPFLKERDVALIGSDGAQEVGPHAPGVSHPIHRFALVALGVHLIDNMELEAVAETAARLKRWEFMLTAAPVPVTNGTGSIINPIAVF